MSFKNGDRSRENRLRKQRERMRAKIREMKAGTSTQSPKAKESK